MEETTIKNRKLWASIGAIAGWFAVFTQLLIVLQNTELSLLGALVRFFSFFTILTNMLVALYFSSQIMPNSNKLKLFFQSPGKLTAIAGYILVVGIVYQIALRHIWNPEGLPRVTDELLHTFIPAFTFSFWLLFEEKAKLRFAQIGGWLLYPLAYILYTLVRGHFTGLYPYPFVNVVTIGYPAALVNTLIIIALFLLLFLGFIGGSKLVKRSGKNPVSGS